MADEPATIGVTGPDGVVYDVPAANMDEANKKFREWWAHNLEKPEFRAAAQQRINSTMQQEYDEAPWYKKPGMAFQDMARVGIDAATAGVGDKVIGAATGAPEDMYTSGARARAGWAAVPMEVASAVKALPSAAPLAVAKMGGGPLARSITGVTTGAVEGGALGGVDAATHQQPVIPGVLSGMGLGATGQLIGNVANKVGKWFKPDEVAPAYQQTKLPKSPVARDYVNVAATEAELAAKKGSSVPVAARDEFANLTVNPAKKTLNQGQRNMVDRIVEGDPADKLYKALGSTSGMAIPGLGLGLGVGTGYASGDPLDGVLAGTAAMAGPRVARAIQSGGTREAVKDLRRSVYGIDQPTGVLSEKQKNQFAKALRQMGITIGVGDED